MMTNHAPKCSAFTAPINWRQLHGRKPLHRIHPTMLEDGGCVRLLKIRPVPYSQYKGSGCYQVLFDRHYVIEKLAHEIGDCGEIPFLDLVELLGEAYARINPDAPIIGLVAEIQKVLDRRSLADPVSRSRQF